MVYRVWPGIADGDDNILLYPHYKKIIIGDDGKCALVQNNQKVYKIELSDPNLNKYPLPYHRIIDHNKNYVRVQFGKEEGKEKMGIIDLNGNPVLDAKFNFIDYTYSADRFKIFTGICDYWNYTLTFRRSKILKIENSFIGVGF